MLTHKGTVTIETERLILRRFEVNDAEDMYKNWAGDDKVTKYLSWPTHRDVQTSKNIIASWVESYEIEEYYHWVVLYKQNNEAIGSAALMNIEGDKEICEIGYCIGKDYWNMGIVTEAFRAIIKFAFCEVGFNRITGRHHLGNNASGRVMEKCGLTYEGTLRQILKNNKGEFVDCKYYSILKEEYDYRI